MASTCSNTHTNTHQSNKQAEVLGSLSELKSGFTATFLHETQSAFCLKLQRQIKRTQIILRISDISHTASLNFFTFYTFVGWQGGYM